MFKKNTHHLQIPLTSHVDELPETLRKRLHNSWAETFYHEFFRRLDEKAFDVLYTDHPSRPNVPVNVLVSLEFLKANKGWTDEELYDNACYDIQVRYALGYRQLGEGYFDLRTLYYFRERLAHHAQETGENLLAQAFEQVTDEQLQAFALKSGKQRMDSTQLASNIRRMGRIQLLVTVLQRVHRMLSEEEQARYAERFAPYLKGHAGQYVYRLKAEDLPAHLQRIGEDISWLLGELESRYRQEPVYLVLARVFTEHFRQEKEKVQPKQGKELSADSLQSPDDLEATYREKHGQGYRGYVANLTETCDPQNPVQLITKVQVAPNNVDDSQLLAEALPNLLQRTDLDTMITDGGFGGAASDQALQVAPNVKHIQTAVRGTQPNPETLHLSAFDIQQDAEGHPTHITCPHGQTVSVTPGRTTGWQARFDPTLCSKCPFQLQGKCPARLQKRDPRYCLSFTTAQIYSAIRRKAYLTHLGNSHNLRSAVEATVRSVKHPFPAGKLPVRGRFRITCMVIGSAAVSNVRRLHRYLQAEIRSEKIQKAIISEQNRLQKRAEQAFSFFVFTLRQAWRTFYRPALLDFRW